MDEAKTLQTPTKGRFFFPLPASGFLLRVNVYRVKRRRWWMMRWMEGWRGAALCGHFCQAALRAPLSLDATACFLILARIGTMIGCEVGVGFKLRAITQVEHREPAHINPPPCSRLKPSPACSPSPHLKPEKTSSARRLTNVNDGVGAHCVALQYPQGMK